MCRLSILLLLVSLALASAGPAGAQTVDSPSGPTAVTVSNFSPDVRAMDTDSAGPGVTVKEWMREIESEWARVWGWRPTRATTIYLYFDGYRMAEGLETLLGEPLSVAEKRGIAASFHGLTMEDRQSGGWAVLVNIGRYYGRPYWEIDTRQVLIHEYAHVMQFDVAGGAGPTWFLEGMAQMCAFTAVPEALANTDRLAVTSELSCRGLLPSLRTLSDSWNSLRGEEPQLAQGMSYFAVKHLADRVGGMPLLEVLRATASGEDFEVALQRVTGYTLDRLDAEYRSEPCGAYR